MPEGTLGQLGFIHCTSFDTQKSAFTDPLSKTCFHCPTKHREASAKQCTKATPNLHYGMLFAQLCSVTIHCTKILHAMSGKPPNNCPSGFIVWTSNFGWEYLAIYRPKSSSPDSESHFFFGIRAILSGSMNTLSGKFFVPLASINFSTIPAFSPASFPSLLCFHSCWGFIIWGIIIWGVIRGRNHKNTMTMV